jgi:hypothetical protein
VINARLEQLLLSGAQPRSARLFLPRPFSGRGSASSVATWRISSGSRPDSVRLSRLPLLSRPHLPAVPPRLTRGLCLALVSLLVVALVLPSASSAFTRTAYTKGCEETLSEDFEGETFNPENPEDVAEVENCEAEARLAAETPDHFDPAPDFDAFQVGTAVVLTAALGICLSSWLIIWVRKTLMGAG